MVIQFPVHPTRIQPQARMSQAIIFDVGETDFSESVLAASHKSPVLVDFWADWCPPCRFLTPVLEKLTQAYQGQVLLAKVEVDENMRLAGRYKLRGFPTVILFMNGEEAGRFSGARTEQQVKAFVAEYVPDIHSLRQTGA